jgi:two-component system, NtrC family, sensor histidine kinase KinB
LLVPQIGPGLGSVMTLSLRYRIVLILLPLVLLVAGMGSAAVLLLRHLSGSIDAILHENYDSVIFMENLNEALDRIDSSFQLALARREDQAHQQYEENWRLYRDSLRNEQNNITVPGEAELVKHLADLTERYRKQGDAFYARSGRDAARREDYAGLLETSKQIKDVAARILRLNQDNMQEASREASRTARRSMIWLAAGVAGSVALAGFLAWHTIGVILRPIRAATQSALAIGGGNLDQIVPVTSRDELGQLASALNTMARQLREYRRTDYSRLLRAQRTSQATIDSFPHPVLVIDPERHVELANPAAQRLLGVIGRKADEQTAVPWQPPAALQQPLVEALCDQRPYLPEGFDQLISLKADGQTLSFLPRILPIQDPYGGTLGAAVLLENVTRFRLLDQVKSDLVATVSHELKTPLTSIRLALHVLLEEVVGPLTPKQIELLLEARENAERLLDRVNSLLDLARLEEKREGLVLRAESPASLLQSAAEAIRPRAEDKGIDLEVEAPEDLPPVGADPERLGHALDNLLDNAVTYTNRGGRITLKAARSDDGVTITIADTGQGIPREYLPHVFERFFRVPGRSRGSGTGLGLAIVREIVNAHGGRIDCTSQPGVGTEFRLTLPLWHEKLTDRAPGHDGSAVGSAALADARRDSGLPAEP